MVCRSVAKYIFGEYPPLSTCQSSTFLLRQVVKFYRVYSYTLVISGSLKEVLVFGLILQILDGTDDVGDDERPFPDTPEMGL
jgi:hypothetical protein